MAEWLAEQGSPVSCCTAVLLGRGDLVKQHLAADRRVVRERGAHDIAILAYTAYAKEQTAIAEQLLQAGADVHARALDVTAAAPRRRQRLSGTRRPADRTRRRSEPRGEEPRRHGHARSMSPCAPNSPLWNNSCAPSSK